MKLAEAKKIIFKQKPFWKIKYFIKFLLFKFLEISYVPPLMLLYWSLIDCGKTSSECCHVDSTPSKSKKFIHERPPFARHTISTHSQRCQTLSQLRWFTKFRSSEFHRLFSSEPCFTWVENKRMAWLFNFSFWNLENMNHLVYLLFIYTDAIIYINTFNFVLVFHPSSTWTHNNSFTRRNKHKCSSRE